MMILELMSDDNIETGNSKKNSSTKDCSKTPDKFNDIPQTIDDCINHWKRGKL